MVTPHTGGQTSSVGATGDPRIDALTRGWKWGGPAGSGAEVTYSFPAAGSVWSTHPFDGYGRFSGENEPWDGDYRGLNAPQKSAFRDAIDAWGEVADIGPRETADTAATVGDIRAAFSGVVGGETVAWAYFPSASPIGGDIWLNATEPLYDDVAPNGFAFLALVHEIGHALGLSHSFEGGRGELVGAEESRKYTVMSYTDHPTVGGQPETPMLYDILAIQAHYGANMTTRVGDTVYQFSDGRETVKALWDAGGNDTIDAGNQALPVAIDLNEGAFSSIGPARDGGAAVDNIAIAYRAEIENAIGGGGGDLLMGNALANDLSGGGGADSLRGRAGADSLSGDGGRDLLIGNGGGDRLDGGGGDDRLRGHEGRDRLAGGSANDRLAGGNGGDVFVFEPGDGLDQITDFRLGDDIIDLSALGIERFGRIDADADGVLDRGDGGNFFTVTVSPGATRLSAGDGDTLVVKGVTDLMAEDFLL